MAAATIARVKSVAFGFLISCTTVEATVAGDTLGQLQGTPWVDT